MGAEAVIRCRVMHGRAGGAMSLRSAVAEAVTRESGAMPEVVAWSWATDCTGIHGSPVLRVDPRVLIRSHRGRCVSREAHGPALPEAARVGVSTNRHKGTLASWQDLRENRQLAPPFHPVSACLGVQPPVVPADQHERDHKERHHHDGRDRSQALNLFRVHVDSLPGEQVKSVPVATRHCFDCGEQAERKGTVRLPSIARNPAVASMRRGRHLLTIRGLATALALGLACQAWSQAPETFSEQVRGLLTSERVQSDAERQKRTNAQIVANVPTPVVVPLYQTPSSPASASTKDTSPAVTRLANSLFVGAQQIRYGAHNTVSADAETLIETFRQSITGTTAQQAQAWNDVKNWAGQGVPEATHFLGFVVEMGLKGQKPDSALAARYYAQAAARGYQPALYNLGLQAGYGRGTRQDLGAAVRFMSQAAERGSDDSQRVCGMGSYLALRAQDFSAASRLAQNCGSPLATLVDVRNNPVGITPQRVAALRQVIATGADDGYAALEALGRANIASDRQLLYCKYRLLGQLRNQTQLTDVRARAMTCVSQARSSLPKDLALTMSDAQLSDALAGFVVAERAALQTLRDGDTFHYGRSVPFLPYRGAEAELFEPVVNAARRSWAATVKGDRS